jgi:hypothetical protein
MAEITRERVIELLQREEAQYEKARPRSKQLFQQAAQNYVEEFLCLG